MPRYFGLLILLVSVSAVAQDMTWREVPGDHLVVMELTTGDTDNTVIIELNPRFAPKTVQQFSRLVKEDFYRGLSFYRVIDGFVAQGGDESDIGDPNGNDGLPPEFEIERDDELPWADVERRDLYQAETGFSDGFAVARDNEAMWLTHCPGIIAMARGTEPDSSSTDFYFVIGQAPRYLDRNLSIFGRVVHGMNVVQKIIRGPTEENGIIENEVGRTRIRSAHMMSDLPDDERKSVYVMDTGSEGFAAYMDGRRNRDNEWFFHTPPKVLDVCQVPVASRVEKPVLIRNPVQE